ncbi:MAG: type II toxin-antitoxin system prevent-host-death family antitoxin [Nitrospirota bacterium]
MPRIAVSVADAKKHFSELLNRVAYGHAEVVVTKRGKPVAVLSAPSERGLGSIKGWLGIRDPFFKDIDRILKERHKHKLRIVKERKG